MFYGLDGSNNSIAVVCLGKRADAVYDEVEVIDKAKENIRAAVASKDLEQNFLI